MAEPRNGGDSPISSGMLFVQFIIRLAHWKPLGDCDCANEDKIEKVDSIRKTMSNPTSAVMCGQLGLRSMDDENI